MEDGPAGSHSSAKVPVEGDLARGTYRFSANIVGAMQSMTGELTVDGRTLQMSECGAGR